MSVSDIEVEGGAVGCAGKLQRGNPSRPRDVVHLVVALVEHAGGVHPPFQILAAIDARRADVLADRQGDLTPRALQLVRDLGAARRSAHDQHAAVGDLIRIAIGLRRQRGDRRRHAVGEARARARCCTRPRPARRSGTASRRGRCARGIPAPSLRTEVTVVWVRTGAEIDLA